MPRPTAIHNGLSYTQIGNYPPDAAKAPRARRRRSTAGRASTRGGAPGVTRVVFRREPSEAGGQSQRLVALHRVTRTLDDDHLERGMAAAHLHDVLVAHEWRQVAPDEEGGHLGVADVVPQRCESPGGRTRSRSTWDPGRVPARIPQEGVAAPRPLAVVESAAGVPDRASDAGFARETG